MIPRLLTNFTRFLLLKPVNSSSVVSDLNDLNFLTLESWLVKRLLTSLDLLHRTTHLSLQLHQPLCHPTSQPAQESVSSHLHHPLHPDVFHQFHAFLLTMAAVLRAPKRFFSPTSGRHLQIVDGTPSTAKDFLFHTFLFEIPGFSGTCAGSPTTKTL